MTIKEFYDKFENVILGKVIIINENKEIYNDYINICQISDIVLSKEIQQVYPISKGELQIMI